MTKQHVFEKPWGTEFDQNFYNTLSLCYALFQHHINDDNEIYECLLKRGEMVSLACFRAWGPYCAWAGLYSERTWQQAPPSTKLRHWLNTHIKETQWLDLDESFCVGSKAKEEEWGKERGRTMQTKRSWRERGRAANSLVTLCSFDFIVSAARISFLSTFRI